MKRINLIACVRSALTAAGLSTVKVVNAVNAALGQLELQGKSDKLGVGSVTKKAYKVTNTVTMKYSGAISMPLLFDAWHCKLEAANKIAEIPAITIPEVFMEWLGAMKSEADPELVKLMNEASK